MHTNYNLFLLLLLTCLCQLLVQSQEPKRPRGINFSLPDSWQDSQRLYLRLLLLRDPGTSGQRPQKLQDVYHVSLPDLCLHDLMRGKVARVPFFSLNLD